MFQSTLMSTPDAVTLFDVGGGQVWVPSYAKTKAKDPCQSTSTNDNRHKEVENIKRISIQ